MSPETITQELRPVDCEQRQTATFKENYNIDNVVETATNLDVMFEWQVVHLQLFLEIFV